MVAANLQQVERLQTEAKLLHEQLLSTQPIMATTDRQALNKKEALEVRSTMHPQDTIYRERQGIYASLTGLGDAKPRAEALQEALWTNSPTDAYAY